jgi:hypothetical protein
LWGTFVLEKERLRRIFGTVVPPADVSTVIKHAKEWKKAAEGAGRVAAENKMAGFTGNRVKHIDDGVMEEKGLGRGLNSGLLKCDNMGVDGGACKVDNGVKTTGGHQHQVLGLRVTGMRQSWKRHVLKTLKHRESKCHS